MVILISHFPLFASGLRDLRKLDHEGVVLASVVIPDASNLRLALSLLFFLPSSEGVRAVEACCHCLVKYSLRNLISKE